LGGRLGGYRLHPTGHPDRLVDAPTATPDQSFSCGSRLDWALLRPLR